MEVMRFTAMCAIEEASGTLAQIRDRLTQVAERLTDIETGLAAAKAVNIERSAKLTLREFTSHLLARIQNAA
jgi:hypothetical protein